MNSKQLIIVHLLKTFNTIEEMLVSINNNYLNIDKVMSEMIQSSMSCRNNNLSFDDIKKIVSLIDKQNFIEVINVHVSSFLEMNKSGYIVLKRGKAIEWDLIQNQVDLESLCAIFMAIKDSRNNVERLSFRWPSIIDVEDRHLKNLLEKGVSETHFHLKGSSFNFSLTWTYIMNNAMSDSVYKVLGKKLKVSLSGLYKGLNPSEQIYKELCLAFFLRYYLYLYSQGEKIVCIEGKLDFEGSLIETMMRGYKLHALSDDLHKVSNLISDDRNYKAYSLENRGTDRKIHNAMMNEYIFDTEEHEVHLWFTPERKMLYQCVIRALNDKDDFVSHLIMLYVNIKNRFRSEIIQSNQKFGFHNFKLYQDRKTTFMNKYMVDHLCALALKKSFEEQPFLWNIEARIMFDKTQNIIRQLVLIERQMKDFIQDNKNQEFTYVMHIGKSEDNVMINSKKTGYLETFCRHYDLRKKAKYCFYITRNLINMKYELLEGIGAEEHFKLLNRLKGIDSCSNEIVARPEVFSQFYRAMKRDTIIHEITNYNELAIGYTYHVGEDFLCPIDGLRACDEAIEFLELSSGDRIGHGTVLGIDLRDWYSKKNFEIYLSKQALLDNLVWVLDIVEMYNLSATSEFKATCKNIALSLFNDIYSHTIDNSIDFIEYRCAMRLRGDNPRIYENLSIRELDYSSYSDLYDWYSTDKRSSELFPLDIYRQNERIKRILNSYHYNKTAKIEGEKSTVFEIKKDWIDILNSVQKIMRKKYSDSGIIVETNPTSNVLISNFNDYGLHPIFNMNNRSLSGDNVKDLLVSINTDDQGVFDTSMLNQYNLIYEALLYSENYGVKYDLTDVLKWMDTVRCQGNQSLF